MDAALSTTRVVVAVPTYRRPQLLERLLPQLVDQMRELEASSQGAYRCSCVVVDNDVECSGAPAVEVFGGRIGYLPEPVPGIAAARNRALDHCAGEGLLVMIDDDEQPETHWLSSLVQTWAETDAALVAGRVVARYEVGPSDPWIEAGQFFVRRNMPTGTPIQVSAAGNVLLDVAQVDRHRLRFDVSFGLTGGEDTLFSRQLAQVGATQVWCAESVVLDLVPRERMTRRWILRRAWSHGNSAALVDLALSPHQRREQLRQLGRGLARVVLGVGRTSLGTLIRSNRHQARGLRTSCRGLGMVAAACGHAFSEYARTEAVAR